MPHVFSLAQGNSSTIRNRKDEHGVVSVEILWKVDWSFPGTNLTLTDTCVGESKSLEELLMRFIDNTWKLGSTGQLFKQARDSVSGLDVYLVNYQKEEVKIDLKFSIREALQDQAILEYPTFIIREPEVSSLAVS